ncbi:protein kinase [Nonomuraea sp. NBC_01738]|uniref:serine/threonine-protein kinase n=1 Tax=Nonomuraea sp. NBC_01738 TaxID=2976003 RepID=UPI002E0E5385|nr:protein kinase [Nonomuraea sp. NBC_01738]
MPEQQTRLLAERYELIAPLGRGTMGTVWRARDRALGREVAVKEIRQDPGLTEEQRAELRERMVREGRTAARISHPSVAAIHDVLIQDNSPWIIMELIEARSMEQVIDEEGPLPPRLVAEIGVDLLGALRAAHSQGITHRDVKPGNVLITETGRVVLTDFGIAKAEGDTKLTKTGMVIGSPGYTAPERARGDYTGPESDIWSLGATLYFAVEGRPAYERSSIAETLAALLSENADPPTQAGQLRPVLTGLLNKDYKQRLTAAQAETMLRMVADTPTNEMPVISPDTPPPGAAAPSPPRPEEGFDPDRTVTVQRPKKPLAPAGPGAFGDRPAPPPSGAFADHPTAPGNAGARGGAAGAAGTAGVAGAGAAGAGAFGGRPGGAPGSSGPGTAGPGSSGAGAPGASGPGASGPGASGPGASGPGRAGPGAPGGSGNGPSQDTSMVTQRVHPPGQQVYPLPAPQQQPMPQGPGPQGAPGAPGMYGPGTQGPGMQGQGMQAPGGMQGPGMHSPGMQGPGMQGPGMPHNPGMQGGPAVPQGRSGVFEEKGLGTDLFAIAGGTEESPRGNRTGMLVLMAVAAVAAVVIAILIVAALG